MSAHEFQIHDRVNELLKLLGVPNNKKDAPGLSEYLEKNRQSFVASAVPIQKAKAKICENSKKPDEFIDRYNDLKGKNCRELDALVYFLAEISDKNEMKQFLSVRPLANTSLNDNLNNTNAANGTSTGSNSSKLSSTALAEMKEKVLKSSGNSNVIQVSPNILSSISKLVCTDKTVLRPKKETILNCPEYPSWNSERLYLSWDFYPNPEKFESVTNNIFNLATEAFYNRIL